MQNGCWNGLVQVSIAMHGTLSYFGKADTENDTEADTEHGMMNELHMHSVLQLLQLHTHTSSLCRAPSKYSRIDVCTKVCALQKRPVKSEAKIGQQRCRQEQKTQVNRHS